MANDGKPAGSSLPAELFQDKVFTEKYVIERDLGVGGAGIVVCARHRELDERVAIKFLLPGPQTSRAVARFRIEARAAHRVKNEHVVRIIDISATETGIPYIVMEYLEGVDLERMLQQSPGRQLPISDAIEFILQACEALAESHGLGIVHRDLKPSNLFCTHGADGLPMIKVLDFGISKLGTGTVDAEAADRGRILGSPRYMSPEQFESAADVDERTDIWAIGIILYELFTGQVPFGEGELFRLRQRIRLATPQPMIELRPDLPAALSPVVLRCLEKNRDLRYPNLAELAKALLPFAPQRSRTSIARIVRIVEAPGCTTQSLALPPVQNAMISDTPTIEAVPPLGSDPRRASRAPWWVVAPLVAMMALLALWVLLRRGPAANAIAAPTEMVLKAAPPETTVAASSAAAPGTTPEPPQPPRPEKPSLDPPPSAPAHPAPSAPPAQDPAHDAQGGHHARPVAPSKGESERVSGSVSPASTTTKSAPATEPIASAPAAGSSSSPVGQSPAVALPSAPASQRSATPSDAEGPHLRSPTSPSPPFITDIVEDRKGVSVKKAP